MDFKKALALFAAGAAALTILHTPFAYPFVLLTTVFHEVGHGLAALASGGEIEKIVIFADGTGYCQHRGDYGFWQRVIILSAGYLGSSLEGSFLLFLTLRLKRGGRIILTFLSLALFAVSALWVRNPFGFVTTICLAVALALAAWRLSDSASELLGIFLCAYVALFAASTIGQIARHPFMGIQGGLTDQSKLAQLTNIPPMLWSLIWLAFAVVALALAIYMGVRRRSGASSQGKFPWLARG